MQQTDQDKLEKERYPFEELFSSTSIIFYRCSLEKAFPITFITKNVEENLGYDREAIYKNSTYWIDRIHPDDRDAVREGFYNILEQKNRVFEYRIRDSEGAYSWIRDENTVIYNDRDQPVSIAGSVIDITDKIDARNKLKEMNDTLEQRIAERTEDLTNANRKLKKQIQRRNKIERKLEENELRYRTYTDLSFDAIFEIDLEGVITDCNPRACQMFGYTKSELVGMHTRELTPDKYKDVQPAMLSEKITTGNEAWERTYKKKDGSLFPTEINTKMYSRGEKKRIIAYVRDISEQKKYEDTIRNSLKEKETLLQEIHHRVKNNLAIISGLLEMQTFNAQNDDLIRELKESQARIQSIAMVHEKLYQTDSFSDISLEQYIDELLAFISDAYQQERTKITVHKNLEPVTLPVTQAIPCGLIINELLTNAYKHAFLPGKAGNIYLDVQSGGQDSVALEVRDDGVGLPDPFDPDSTSTLGMTLVQTLVKQLEGSLEISSDEGACFTITFPIY